MRKEHEVHANSSMQNHLSMAISKLDALENKITLTVDTLENKIASKVNALENKIMLRVESLETKTVSKAVALENKITSKVESFENKIASEVVALENKITSTVDALKNELISKVDAQKDEIMLHEKNLEIIKAFLAVKTQEFVSFHALYDARQWLQSPPHHPPCSYDDKCTTARTHQYWISLTHDYKRSEFLNCWSSCKIDLTKQTLYHVHLGTLYPLYRKMHKKFID
ncbi:uncharacterized protein LOC136084360 [Hydra vulgaris]|uniref:Uncharacterized protein LOC136084360 n=1 Tax=Hydra vulgaris TaxID=6087 RepID=A0ABM4CFH5_HYDVU